MTCIAVRLGVAAMLAGAGAWAVLGAPSVRAAEATIAGQLTHLATGSTTRTYGPRAAFYWDLFTPKAHGLIVTPECSSAYTAGPLLIGLGVVAMLGRFRPARIALAGAAAMALIVTTNLLRLTMIASSIHVFGPRAGLWWSHLVIGSVLSIASIVLGIAVVVRVGVVDGSCLAPSAEPSPPLRAGGSASAPV